MQTENDVTGKIVSVFDHLGLTGDAVVFCRETMTVIFNMDCGFISAFYTQGNSDVLATIAAGHIAHELGESHEEFARIFSLMMQRHVAAEVTP